jgi:phosphatidylserine decarboxylase
MKIDRAGVPFIAAALLPTVYLLVRRRRLAAAPFAAAAGLLVFFFRDPERVAPGEADAVLAPADGRVMVAGDPEPGVPPPGAWRQVSIFLSPRDVHVNRSPVGGRVLRVEYRRGRFLPAYRRDAARLNERTEIWIERDGETIVCRQVVGILARRVVCRVRPGETLTAGQRLGIMKFGSRMDVFLPQTAVLCVSIGDRVRAAESVLARLPRRPQWDVL